MKVIILIRLLIIVILMPAVSFAASEARVVLKEYLHLDANGARLQEWQSEKFLLNWEVEQGWDTATIITGYSIKSEKCSDDRCTYEVEYTLYPTKNEPQVVPNPKGGKQIITYNLLKRNGQWFLEDFSEPHVLLDSYKRLIGGR